ncbi:MAG: hypothetical protein FD174_1348 [Geobacteraceae bacterium]|nr:MAG: hypothetical protein FD174_1348 [Geobacteraceae bacterium]
MKIEESNQQAIINPFKNERVEQVGGKDGKPVDAAGKPQAGRDNVALSPAAEHLNKATASQELPEFRADRVAELKATIEAGEYKVNSRDVAAKMYDKLKQR